MFVQQNIVTDKSVRSILKRDLTSKSVDILCHNPNSVGGGGGKNFDAQALWGRGKGA